MSAPDPFKGALNPFKMPSPFVETTISESMPTTISMPVSLCPLEEPCKETKELKALLWRQPVGVMAKTAGRNPDCIETVQHAAILKQMEYGLNTEYIIVL